MPEVAYKSPAQYDNVEQLVSTASGYQTHSDATLHISISMESPNIVNDFAQQITQDSSNPMSLTNLCLDDHPIQQTSPLLSLPPELQHQIMDRLYDGDTRYTHWGILWERSLQMTCRHFRQTARFKPNSRRLTKGFRYLSCHNYAFMWLLSNSEHKPKVHEGYRASHYGCCFYSCYRSDDLYFTGVGCEGDC